MAAPQGLYLWGVFNGQPKYALNSGGRWYAFFDPSLEQKYGTEFWKTLDQAPSGGESATDIGSYDQALQKKAEFDAQEQSKQSNIKQSWVDSYNDLIKKGYSYNEAIALNPEMKQYVTPPADPNAKGGADAATPTDFQSYFASELKKGRSASDILANNPYKGTDVMAAATGGQSAGNVVPSPSAPAGYGINTATGKFEPLPTGSTATPSTEQMAKDLIASGYDPAVVSGLDPNAMKNEWNIINDAKTSGWNGQMLSSSGGGSVGDTGSATYDPDATRARLQELGVDVSTLTDDQVKTLGMMQSVIDKRAEADKSIAPPSLSQADMAKFLDDAKTEIDPYYREQFDLAKRDLLQTVGYLSGENTYQEQQLAEQQRVQQEQLAASMAERGLGRSGIRTQAEQKLKEQQAGVVESGRRSLQNTIYGLGSQFEKQFGTTGVQTAGLPTVTSAAFPSLALPQSTIAYQPSTTPIMGTAGKEQTTAEIADQQRLAADALAKKQALQPTSSAF